MAGAKGILSIVRDTHGFHQSFLVCHCKTIPVIGIVPSIWEVNLIQIDGFASQPVNRFAAGIEHILRLCTERKCSKFTSNLHFIGLLLGILSAELSQQLLRASNTVQFSRIKKCELFLHRIIKHFSQIAVILLIISPKETVAPSPGAQADGRQIDGAPQRGHLRSRRGQCRR